jgi:hypothetical protein
LQRVQLICLQVASLFVYAILRYRYSHAPSITPATHLAAAAVALNSAALCHAVCLQVEVRASSRRPRTQTGTDSAIGRIAAAHATL